MAGLGGALLAFAVMLAFALNSPAKPEPRPASMPLTAPPAPAPSKAAEIDPQATYTIQSQQSEIARLRQQIVMMQADLDEREELLLEARGHIKELLAEYRSVLRSVGVDPDIP